MYPMRLEGRALRAARAAARLGRSGGTRWPAVSERLLTRKRGRRAARRARVVGAGGNARGASPPPPPRPLPPLERATIEELARRAARRSGGRLAQADCDEEPVNVHVREWRRASRSGAASGATRAQRGVVWRIRYRDASGRRVLETLGKEPDLEPKARRARASPPPRRRRARGLPQPEKVTFGAVLRAWLERVPARARPQADDGRRLSRRRFERHLLPVFGRYTLQELERRPELVDRYVTEKMHAGLSPKTVDEPAPRPPGDVEARGALAPHQPKPRRRLRAPARRAAGAERPHPRSRSRGSGPPTGSSRQTPRTRSRSGGGWRARSPSSLSGRRCAEASFSPFAGETCVCSKGACRCARRSSRVASRPRSHALLAV